MAMTLRNINPLGAVTLFLPSGAVPLDVLEEFEVSDEDGAALLLQAGNYEEV